MKILKSVTLIVAILLLFISSCTSSGAASKSSVLQQWMSDNGKLKVLCTTSMIADIVKEVGCEHVDCLALIQGESDPHSYQLVKGDDEKLARADLLFYNGLGLEHGPSLHERLKGNPKAFSIGEYLSSVRPNDIITYNGALDPHIWMDVSLWSSSVSFIADKLAQANRQHADIFQQNSSATYISLQSLHKDILKRFSEIPENKLYLVSAHEAFNYFVRAYLATNQERVDGTWMVRSMAPEGLAPDSQLSTADIQRLVTHIIKYNITTLFAESNVSRDSLKKLMDACLRKGHQVYEAPQPLYVDAMGPVGSMAHTYKGMMLHDSETIATGLEN